MNVTQLIDALADTFAASGANHGHARFHLQQVRYPLVRLLDKHGRFTPTYVPAGEFGIGAVSEHEDHMEAHVFIHGDGSTLSAAVVRYYPE